MSFDKSLRLLNYAKSELGGYLELYTELDHDFVVGDIVYIIGGYYDNTNELLYINNYSSGTPTKYNPFSVHKHGYEILYIDYTKNSFVIDFQVNPLNIIYPYGTDSNKFGNPQDNVNLAYNTFVSNDMYKDIYVSRTCFIKGRFNKGTINNGVFGNDNQNVIIGKHPNMVAYSSTTDITINHIASKNMELTAGVINSKTDGTNPISKKIKLIEDLTISPINPFAINNVVVGNNNDGYGYNTFETFLHYGDIIINNGVFDNAYDNNIIINTNATINKFKFGANEPMFGTGCILDNVNVDNSLVLNYSPTTATIHVNNSRYDTYIDLKVNTFTFDATPGFIIFDVEYDVVANKIWTNGEIVHLLGFITPGNVYDYNLFNSELFGTIISTSYTFGDINSAQIVISCPVLIPDWASILLTLPINYDVSNLKLTFTNYFASDIYFKNNNIISTYSDVSTCVIDDYNQIIYGYYDSITYTNLVDILSSNIGLITLLYNSIQIVNDIYNIPTFTYTLINGNTYKTSANIVYSKITGGIFYNGSLAYTQAIPIGIWDLYLDNMVLYNGARVESSVYWNDVNIQFYGETTTGLAFETLSYLGDRKTPWFTEDTINIPMSFTSRSSELNKITGTRGNDLAYYTSQYKITSYPYTHINHYDLKVELPNLMNIQIPLDNTKKCAIIDNGSMYYNSGAWYLNPEVKRPLYFNTIPTQVMNRSNNVTSGTYTDFPGVALPPASVSDIVRVDDNWVYNDLHHYYTTAPITQSDISINVYDIIPTPATFPDPANNTPETLMFLRLDANTGPDIDNIYDDNVTPTAIHNAIYTMYFRQPGTFNNSAMGAATNIPACFIEIEQVKIIKKDLLDVVQSANIYYSNYCPSFTGATGGTEYAWDNIKTVAAYPTDYKILDNSANDITFEMTSTDKFEIIVEYWITWFYIETALNSTLENNPYFKTNYKGGYRTKHELRHIFEPSNETYYILGESGDTLVDDNGDNLVWI